MDYVEDSGEAGRMERSCKNCGADDFTTGTDAYTVCQACGITCGPTLDGGSQYHYRVRVMYQRVFYFNELLSQYGLYEPAIPPPLLELLRQAWKKRPLYDRLDRERVHTLCRSVSVKKDPKIPSCFWVPLSEELSQQYAAKSGTKLKDLRHYGEKWRRISFEFTGRRPPKLSVQALASVRRWLETASRVFEVVRHAEECDGKAKCHRRFNCRKSIINSNYLIRKALLFYYRGDRKNKKYRAHCKWLPCPERANRHKLRLRYFQPMVERVGGEWKKYWPRPNYF